jgi:alpha-glucosidase
MGPYKFQTTPFNWDLPALKAAIAGTQGLIRGTDGWTTAFLENHDQARSVSRFASDAPEHRIASGKMLALMMMAMSGTLFIYQGQELGMVNFPLDWDISEYKDIDALNYVSKKLQNDVNCL